MRLLTEGSKWYAYDDHWSWCNDHGYDDHGQSETESESCSLRNQDTSLGQSKNENSFYSCTISLNVTAINIVVFNNDSPVKFAIYSSSQHNFRMHFLVQSISQRILVNLTNRSSLVLKFENVANTDFSATPFFGDRGNFGYIPFLSVYNHAWCLNRDSLTRWIVSRGLFYLKTFIYPNLGQRPDFMRIFTPYHTFNTL